MFKFLKRKKRGITIEFDPHPDDFNSKLNDLSRAIEGLELDMMKRERMIESLKKELEEWKIT